MDAISFFTSLQIVGMVQNLINISPITFYVLDLDF